MASISARIASTAPVRLSSLSKRDAEAADLLAIDVGHPGVQQLRHLGCIEAGLQFGLPRFERQQLVFDRQRGHAVLDRLNKLPDFTFDARELPSTVRQTCAMFHPQAVQLPHVLAAEVLEQVAAHQLVAQCHENAFLPPPGG